MDEGSDAGPRQALHYDGRIGQLYRIFLVNLLLTVITLGIYRFWAMTRWAHRDATVMLLRELGIGFVVASLGWNDTLGGAGGIGRDLLALSFSRRAEAAADAAGELFLIRAGLRADGLGRFFGRLETIEGHGTLPWLATHPPTDERKAQATHSTAGAPPLSDAEWAAVRRMCEQ